MKRLVPPMGQQDVQSSGWVEGPEDPFDNSAPKYGFRCSSSPLSFTMKQVYSLEEKSRVSLPGQSLNDVKVYPTDYWLKIISELRKS